MYCIHIMDFCPEANISITVTDKKRNYSQYKRKHSITKNFKQVALLG